MSYPFSPCLLYTVNGYLLYSRHLEFYILEPLLLFSWSYPLRFNMHKSTGIVRISVLHASWRFYFRNMYIYFLTEPFVDCNMGRLTDEAGLYFHTSFFMFISISLSPSSYFISQFGLRMYCTWIEWSIIWPVYFYFIPNRWYYANIKWPLNIWSSWGQIILIFDIWFMANFT